MPGQVRKSGVNLRLPLTGETYDGTYTGQVECDSVSQVSLVHDLGAQGITSIPCWQVLVQASANNTAVVHVGNESQGCYVELPAGVALTIPVNDVNKIYVRAAAGIQTVNWIAMI